MRPNLAGVLAEIRPGRVELLTLSPEQKRDFRDPDGRLALDVLRHLLGARAASAPAQSQDVFPLTELTFQAVARKLGTQVGQKRSRRLSRRLAEAGVILPAGSYPQQHGSRYRVRLWRLAAGVRRVLAPASRKRPVGRGRSVKGADVRRWWEHRLFGMADGRPPPALRPKDRRRWKSKDEVKRGFGWRLVRDRSARLRRSERQTGRRGAQGSAAVGSEMGSAAYQPR